MKYHKSLLSILTTASFLISVTSISAYQKSAVNPELLALEKKVISTVENVKDSVVAIVMKDENENVVGSGSGVIVSEKGLIYTAAHVVDGFDNVLAITSDGEEHKVRVLGMNRYKDAAVCRMLDTTKKYAFSPSGDSDALKVTDWVIAMGHGRGYDKTRTAPVRFGRVRAHNPGRFITTDCPLIGGDSGGPVFDLSGNVIAINSSINGLARFNVHAGVSGFTDDLSRMRSGESWGTLLPNVLYTPETPLLGVIFPNARYGRQKHHLLEPVIEDVAKGGPADKAGIRGGDLIRMIGDEEIETRLDLEIALGRQKVGESVEVIIQRRRELFKTEVILSSREKAEDLRNSIDSPLIANDQDSLYVKDKDKPLLKKQALEVFSWASPLGKAKSDSYIQLYNSRDIETPLLNATIIKDGIALAPLSAFETLRPNLFAWRPGLDAHPVKLIGAYEAHDLAVLSIDGLTSTQDLLGNSREVKVGEFVNAVSKRGSESDIIKMGVVSVEKRDLTGYLGVGSTSQEGGALITFVDRNKTAFKMGLRIGNIIRKINDSEIENAVDLGNAISEIKVGDNIKIEFERNGTLITEEAILGGKGNGSRSGRIDMMDQLGRNSLSRNTDSFQTVIQSDMLVEPEECGAPIFTLDGAFTGIAISDAGRNKTYIIPASSIKEALKEEPTPIKAPEVATTQTRQSIPQPQNQTLRGNSIPRGRADMMKRHQEMMDRLLKDHSSPGSNDPFKIMEEMQKRQEEMINELLGR